MVHEKRAYIAAAFAGGAVVRLLVGLAQLSLEALLLIGTLFADSLVVRGAIAMLASIHGFLLNATSIHQANERSLLTAGQSNEQMLAREEAVTAIVQPKRFLIFIALYAGIGLSEGQAKARLNLIEAQGLCKLL